MSWFDADREPSRTVLLPPADAAAVDAEAEEGRAMLAAATAIPDGAQWYPAALHMPLPGGLGMGGVLSQSRGLVLHVQDGNNSPYGWFSNPSTQASAHWWVSKAGQVEQYVPAGREAWHARAANALWHGAETEGYPGEPLTEAQIGALADLYRWGSAWWGWPSQLADTPAGFGFGWHGMGGDAWGGHFDCPGDLRCGQRAAILTRAHSPEADVTPDEMINTLNGVATAPGQSTFGGTVVATLVAGQHTYNAATAASAKADQALAHLGRIEQMLAGLTPVPAGGPSVATVMQMISATSAAGPLLDILGAVHARLAALVAAPPPAGH